MKLFLVVLYCLASIWASFFCYHYFKLDFTAWYGIPYAITCIACIVSLPVHLMNRSMDRDLKKLLSEDKQNK